MIQFHTSLSGFELPFQELLKPWLHKIASQEHRGIRELNYVFCDDKKIVEINRHYLRHDYPTDIITFPYSYNPVEAEIYISINTVRSNSVDYGVRFETELLRVIAHGLLHMLGYDDQTEIEKESMRNREEKTILLFQSLYPHIIL